MNFSPHRQKLKFQLFGLTPYGTTTNSDEFTYKFSILRGNC